MRTSIFALVTSLALASLGSAAISLTGTALSGINAASIPVGSVVLLIADNSGNGLLGTPSLSGNLTAAADPNVTLAGSGINLGESFGGDLILGRTTVTSAGALPGGFTFDNTAGLQGRSFALVFFPALTSGSTSVVGSTPYGIVSGSDWILPSANTGQSYAFSSSDISGADSFFRVVVTAGDAANDTFTTPTGAVFTFGVIPEPSTALLGAIGALGLLRRRR